MKLIKSLLFISSLLAIASSCNPDDKSVVNEVVTATNDMKVPYGFDYNTSGEVVYDISTTSIWGKEKIKLEIFDFAPNSGGKVISSQFLDGFGKAKGNLNLEVSATSVFARLSYPDGSSQTEKVSVVGNSAVHNFMQKTTLKKATTQSPNCNAGCEISVVNNNGHYLANTAAVYCFTGNTKGKIEASNGAIVRVCGTGSFEAELSVNAKMEITDGTVVTIEKLTHNADAGELIIFSDANVSFSDWCTPSGDIVNYGIASFLNLNINATCKFSNHGNVNVHGTGWYAVDGDLDNYGRFHYNGNVSINNGGDIKNYCNFGIARQLMLNGGLDNASYLRVDQLINIGVGGGLILRDRAMVSSQDVTTNGNIQGLGETSLLKITDKLSGSSQANIMGNLQICDANGIEGTFSGDIISPAIASCDLFIPRTSCMLESNGNANVQDDDFDGVANNLDLYPNDPSASAASFYPSDSGLATLMFEDLWPGKGDYDFNDMVVNYCHKMVSNTQNKVVRVESVIFIKAIGGSLKNGFGFQFDVSPNLVENVTGSVLNENIIQLSTNGTEANQSKATIIAFDNANKTIVGTPGAGFVNTNRGIDSYDVDTIRIVTTFNQPVTLEELGAAPFNPFIFIDKDRGRELHLVNQQPTDLMNESYFQTRSDDSNPTEGRTYVSRENHPWALNFNQDVDHMLEKTDIVLGYNYFADWAQSAGVMSSDWYVDHNSYKNEGNLY